MPHKGGDSIEITSDMVQVNSLCTYENVKDIYWLKGYDVYNVVTGHRKSVTVSQRYPYVTLEQYGNTTPKKCLMHHLIALAYISNNPFKVIEHLNDIPTDYNISNLCISNQSSNLKRMFLNGHSNRTEKKFLVTLVDGTKHKGTIKELSVALGIPRQTLYASLYRKSKGKKIQSVVEIRSTDYRKEPERIKFLA